MAVKFPTAVYGSLSSVTWLDNVSKMAFFCAVRFDTITTANKQYVFMHRLGTSGDQYSLRKDSTSDKFRFSVTAGGVNATCDTTTVLSAGTVYFVGGNWERGISGGMRLYLTGVADGNNPSTTTQTTDYATSGGTLYVNKDSGTQYGICTLENFILFPGVTLSATDFLQLSQGTQPELLPVALTSMAARYRLPEDELTVLTDYSPNMRSITSITGAPQAGGNFTTSLPFEMFPPPVTSQGTVTAPSPNPWTDLSPDIFHVQNVASYSATISGLTNGIPYQLKVVAIDAGGNMSVDSAIVEATPTAPAPTVSTLIVPWRKDRNFSKFKPSQQG